MFLKFYQPLKFYKNVSILNYLIAYEKSSDAFHALIHRIPCEVSTVTCKCRVIQHKV